METIDRSQVLREAVVEAAVALVEGDSLSFSNLAELENAVVRYRNSKRARRNRMNRRTYAARQRSEAVIAEAEHAVAGGG